MDVLGIFAVGASVILVLYAFRRRAPRKRTVARGPEGTVYECVLQRTAPQTAAHFERKYTVNHQLAERWLNERADRMGYYTASKKVTRLSQEESHRRIRQMEKADAAFAMRIADGSRERQRKEGWLD